MPSCPPEMWVGAAIHWMQPKSSSRLLKPQTHPFCSRTTNSSNIIQVVLTSLPFGCGRETTKLLIIMLAYLYCAAYTRRTMYESSPPCEQRCITFNDDGQRVQLARPELPAPHYMCMYRLLPTTPPIIV